MILKILYFALVITGSQAAKCGVPDVASIVSPVDTLLALLTGKSSGRIVGGVEATPHSWPWQVALLSYPGDMDASCGGSIINKQWIMTAAHCCSYIPGWPKPEKDIKIRVGAHDLESFSEANAKNFDVTQVVIHPLYDDNPATTYDFCLLKLDRLITYSSHVSPICLPDLEDGRTGQQCFVTGWGSTRAVSGPHRAAGNPLREVAVTVTDQAKCQKSYQENSEPRPITADMICASAPGKDSCQGDSGGPFVCQAAPGEPFKLVGVVSWGFGCADSRYPGVYARTSSALDWIQATIFDQVFGHHRPFVVT